MAAAAAASADPHKAVTIRSSVQPSICNQAMIIWWQSRFYCPKNESNARQRDGGNQMRRIRECMYCHAINVSVALHFDLRFEDSFLFVYIVYMIWIWIWWRCYWNDIQRRRRSVVCRWWRRRSRRRRWNLNVPLNWVYVNKYLKSWPSCICWSYSV